LYRFEKVLPVCGLSQDYLTRRREDYAKDAKNRWKQRFFFAFFAPFRVFA
jgi:hypothetical protein